MMKKKMIKRAGVAVLSMAMLLSMGAVGGLTASAAATNNNTVTVSVNNSAGNAVASTAANAVKVYQVAKVDGTGHWVWNTATAPQINGKKVYFYASQATAGETEGTNYVLIKDVTSAVDRNALATALVALVNDNLKVVQGSAGSALKLEDIDSATTPVDVDIKAYYLVTTDANDAATAIQPSLVEIDGTQATSNTSVSPKADAISLEKKITNVSAGQVAATGDTACAVINATVNYSITTEIPTYAADVTDTDDFLIYDNPDAGIAINNTDFSENGSDVIVTLTNTSSTDVVAYNKNVSPTEDVILTVGGESVAVRASAAGDGNDSETVVAKKVSSDTDGFTVVIPGKVVAEYPGYTVTVTFKATVDTDAQLGSVANNNDVLLTYSNNFSTGTGSTKHQKDEVGLYVGKVELIKKGLNADGTDDNTNYAASFTLTGTAADGQTAINKGTVSTTASGALDLGYLEPGTYTLHETVPPTGHRVVGDYTFTIENQATYDAAADYTKYEVIPGTAVTDSHFSPAVTVVDMTRSNNNGQGLITVKDPVTDSLPGTGGIGTYIFTFGGAAVVLFAGFMFVLYMRKRRTEEE